MSNTFSRFLILCVAVSVLAACSAKVPPLNIEDPAIDVVWPKAPDAPRVKLLRVLKGAEDLVDRDTTKNRLFGWLTGEMAEQIPLVAPYGLATDGAGMIWITDPGAHAVHALDLNKRTGRLWTLAGKSFFSSPTGICFDPIRKRIYVADSITNKIVVLTPQGKFLSELQPDPAFDRPGGMALDPQGNLLVADVLAGKVRRFSPSGDELPAFGSPTTPSGLFNRPIGVASDSNGLIYVIDSLNFRIEVLSQTGDPVSSIGGLGNQPGNLSRPRGLAVDRFGHIYVADAAFDNIQVFNLKGELLLVFGGDGKYGLSMPASLQVDTQNRIYAVDSFNHQIQVYQFLGSGD